MIESAKRSLKLVYKAAYQTVMDDGVEHAGYLSFLAILSIFPATIFLFIIAGTIGKQDYGAQFLKEVYNILPANVMSAISPAINEILSGPPQGLLTFAIIGILWTSSSTVEGLRGILNKVYRVTTPPHYLFRRLLSVLQFVVLVFILLIAMFFLTVAPNLLAFAESKFHTNINIDPMFTVIRYYASAAGLFIGIATTYYVLPNIKQNFLRVLPGAIICTGLWLLTIDFFTGFFSYYNRASVVYGSLAGVVITLIFFYVLNIIYIFGAEFNYLLEKELGHKIEEKE